jgi:hypothetical protein
MIMNGYLSGVLKRSPEDKREAGAASDRVDVKADVHASHVDPLATACFRTYD